MIVVLQRATDRSQVVNGEERIKEQIENIFSAFGDAQLESTKVNKKERKEEPEKDATATVYV